MIRTKRSNRQTAARKNPLTYAISSDVEQEIREYVNNVHTKTGLPINRIVSNLLIDSVRRAKKFYPANSENSER